nr:phosphatidylinositol 4-phosphate 5-kinase 8 [Ipomoea batatas]
MENSERTGEKVFPNGDVYIGMFKGVLPHGKGKYTSSDGTTYDGDWEEGKMTGKGWIIWSSGATYDGDCFGGYLHGFGTFSSSDGSVYKGHWKMNIHHGVGRKEYQNSDVYDGCWKEGVRDGHGRYAWSNGNMYTGIWKKGNMSGRGVMKWFNGDLFDGFWVDGLRHGSGCYRFADGSYYFGTWSNGLKDGRGTLYPVGCDLDKCKIDGHKEIRRMLSHDSSISKEDAVKHKVKRSISEKIADRFARDSGRISRRAAVSVAGDAALHCSSTEVLPEDASCMLSHTTCDGKTEQQGNITVAYEREYMQGVLIRERIKSVDGLSHQSTQRRKFPAKEVRKGSCMDLFKGRKSYYLMLNLQLGIRYSVGKITPIPMREVRQSDFGDQARIKMYFPRKGSRLTPPHRSIDFYWKDYCPIDFRNLRVLFKLNAADYMMSICCDDGLRELLSPGKSGSIFYLSCDDRFVIKTLKKSELKVLLKMLPSYYKHVKDHENTLITKFFGVYRISLRRRKKVRFVVMGNMFYTELHMHHRYDLKGSSLGRFTDKDKIEEGTTLKDLDLMYEFRMDKLLHETLIKQLSLDSQFLESQHIIDYSLLLGLHFRAPEHLTALLEPPDSLCKPKSTPGGISHREISILPRSLTLVTHEPSIVSTAPGPHIRGKTLRANSVGDREVDLLLPGTGRLRVQLGVNMPAQANRKVKQEETDTDPSEVELFEVYDVVLYLGIIDILQAYNMRKKLEHKYKSLRFDPMSISVIEPKLYSKRFISFLERVFRA